MKQFLYSVAMGEKKGPWVRGVKVILWLLSLIYHLGIGTILFFYRIGVFKKYRLKRPVISVGNITVGGVGKTPFVEMLAKELKVMGYKPVILMRGYMDKKKHTLEGDEYLTDQGETSDEALMLKRSLGEIPILVGANRIKNANEYLKEHDADWFIMDDGFQHWKLHRDLDILAMDATNPWGNGGLIPLGILREPLSSLGRADMIVLTKTDMGEKNLPEVLAKIEKKREKGLILKTIHKPISLINFWSGRAVDFTSIQDKKICCFSGIGDPASFEKSLKGLGFNVERSFFFMDHYRYTKGDINDIINYCMNNSINTIITTSKDAVKLGSLDFINKEKIKVYYLNMHLIILNGKDEFFERVCRLSYH